MKTIIISGGTSGLGFETAKLLSKDHTVIILGLDKVKLKKTSTELGVESFLCDVSDWTSVFDTVKKIIKKHKKVDFVINNAGLWIEGELEKNEPEKIKRVIEVNLLGAIFLTKAFIPHFKVNKAGAFININSQGGFYAKADRSIYTASKWGMTGFAKALDPELLKYGIRTINIHPGKMDTPFFIKDPSVIKKEMLDALDPVEVAKVIKFIVDLPEDVTIPELGVKSAKIIS